MEIYAAGSNLTGRNWNNDLLNRLSIQLSAWDGEVGVGAATMPDPSGNDDFKGGRSYKIADSGVVLVDGFIHDQYRTRGEYDPMFPQREHVYQLQDPNALAFGFIVYEVRPEETDRARWLHFLSVYRPTWDTTWILSTNAVTLPAKTYRGENGFDELITDTREMAGKTFWVHDKVDGGRCAHMHRSTEGHAAGIEVSDDWTLVDGVTIFAPAKFPSRTFSPADLTTKLRARDQDGRTVLLEDATAIADHDVDGMHHSRLVEFETSSQAELQTRAQQFLTEHKTERQTYLVGITNLDFAAMAKWRVGDLLNVTSNVLGMPGTVSPIRIAHATITVSKDDNGNPLPGFWDCEFELGSPIRAVRPTSGKNNLINRPITPYVPGGASGAVAYRTMWVNAQPSFGTASSTTTNITPVAGELLLAISSKQDQGTHSWTAGWTEVLDSINTVASESYAWKIADGTETSVTVTYSVASVQRHLAVVAITGGAYAAHATPSYASSGTTQTLPNISPSAGSPVVLVATAWSKQGYSISVNLPNYTERNQALADSGTDSSRHTIWTRAIPAPSGAYGGSITYASGLAGWAGGQIVISGQSGSPPDYGQWTSEVITGDGTTGPYQTNYPYLLGSLTAYDPLTGAVWTLDQTDPDNGEFETDAVLPVGQTLVIRYQVNGNDATGATNPQPTPATPTAGGDANIVDLDWFDVTDAAYGAVGDGATDDTTAIQDAVDACYAAGGGTVYFPAGEYLISGALQDTGARNGQIVLTDVSTSDPQVVIRFKGALRAPIHAIGIKPTASDGYSILRSTITGGSGTAAVISGGNEVFTARNNSSVVVEDLICLSPDNPSLTWWNLMACQGGAVRDTLVSVVTWSTASEPTHTNAYGIRLPQRGQSNFTDVNGVIIGGHYTGIQIGELTIARGLVVGLDLVGVELTSAPHASMIVNMQQSACQIGVRVTSGSFPVSSRILLYDAEHYSSPAWAETIYDFDDPDDAFVGDVTWWGADFSGPVDHVFNINGGANGIFTELGEVGSATPTGAAGGDLSGTYPNPSVTNDSHSHTASTIDLTGEAAGGDLSGTYPNPSVVDDSHNHTSATAPGGGGDAVGPILIADIHSTPLVFADLLQTEAGDDLLYADA